jgi:MFS family permease
MVGIFAALAAIPMGYAASRWGRRRMIRISLVVIVLLLIAVFSVEPLCGAGLIPASSAKFLFWA